MENQLNTNIQRTNWFFAHKFLWLIVGVLSLVILGIVYFFISTINWKTYNDVQNGFKLKYPKEYTVRSDYGTVHFENKEKNLIFSLSILENKFKLSSMKYVEAALLDYGVQQISVKSVNINGVEVADTVLKLGNSESRSVYVVVKDKLINMQYHLSDDYFEKKSATDEQKRIYLKNSDIIISSFKLTN